MAEEQGHTLRIRCPTWDHLENFYERKVKDGNVLLARVPFAPLVGSSLTIALELPDGLIVDIQAKVEGVRQAPDGRKSAIRMLLADMEGSLGARLRKAVALGRKGAERGRPLTLVPPTAPRTETGLPVPIPADVPIDELVEPIILPAIDEVEEADRARYRELHEELSALREKAAHEVLGVAWDAEVAEIRKAYFGLVKIYHPDVVARHGSAAIGLLAAEIFMYVNQAYDRLRDSAVAAGKAIIAGPALLPHRGWIANFDDIGTAKPRRPLRSDDMSGPTRAPDAARSVTRASPTSASRSQEGMTAPDESAEISVQFGAQASKKSSKRAGDPGEATPVRAGHIGSAELFADARVTERGMTPLESDDDTGEAAPTNAAELVAKGENFLKAEDFEAARNLFASALEEEPRSRQARALYHVAYGQTLLARGKSAEAMTQFEVALKHDPECEYARIARSSPRGRERRPSLLKRLFRR